MAKGFVSKKVSDLRSEASSWIAQLETGELTPADQEAFREWIQRSPRHAEEIRRLAEFSLELNMLSEMAEPMRQAAGRYRSLKKRGGHYFFWQRKGLVATFAAAVVMVVSLFYLQTLSPEPQSMLILTSVGEYRDEILPDQSLIRLNAKSQIEVTYSKHARKIRLLQGEAFFEVEPDKNRPFFVYAGHNYVRAIGTAFLVRLDNQNVSVTVTEGKIEVADAEIINELSGQADARAPDVEDESFAPLVLKVGQKVSISHHYNGVGSVETLSPRQIRREMSWREGLHDFSKTPIEEVVRELGRHTDFQIEIIDESIRNIEFGGIFRIGETEPLLHALQSAYGINVEYLNDNKARLSLPKTNTTNQTGELL